MGYKQDEELIEADVRSVMASAAGRHVLRWILDGLRPAVISGPDCARNAALYDAATILEATLYSIDPSAWTVCVQERAQERLVRTNQQENDHE